jgi:hypothetical protein
MVIAIDGTDKIDISFIRANAIWIDSDSWLSSE